MITPILETNRILLRPFELSAAQTMYNNWASDPIVSKYMEWNTHQSVEESAEWLQEEQDKKAEETYYNWGLVLKEQDEIIGFICLFYNEQQQMYEFGYGIMESMWNKGLTTEAAKRVIDFAVNELGITSFYANYAKENPASGSLWNTWDLFTKRMVNYQRKMAAKHLKAGNMFCMYTKYRGEFYAG